MIKLLIFDLDGTLVDTSVDITNAINYAVEPFGVEPLSVETVKSMVGSGITKLIEGLIPPQSPLAKEGREDFRDETVRRFLEYYSKHLLDNTRPYLQVKETLSKLYNFKKAVISNKRESLSKEVLEGLGLLEFFALVLGSDSVPERKPSPVPVLEVLKRLGVSKYEAVMIGDSNYDIGSAHAAGVKIIAVTYGYRSRDVLKDADFMIDNFKELLDILPQLRT
ncbi:MAG: HAD-IA family hydrolase [Nitrospirae bacterium]|nr:HAD-IA family hydrolase [Nitrospirota bacterium]